MIIIWRGTERTDGEFFEGNLIFSIRWVESERRVRFSIFFSRLLMNDMICCHRCWWLVYNQEEVGCWFWKGEYYAKWWFDSSKIHRMKRRRHLLSISSCPDVGWINPRRWLNWLRGLGRCCPCGVHQEWKSWSEQNPIMLRWSNGEGGKKGKREQNPQSSWCTKRRNDHRPHDSDHLLLLHSICKMCSETRKRNALRFIFHSSGGGSVSPVIMIIMRGGIIFCWFIMMISSIMRDH